MARGWESKAIESQQEQSAADKLRAKAEVLTREDLEKRARRATLELARARAAADLARARTPAHKAMLQQAIDSLDNQLKET